MQSSIGFKDACDLQNLLASHHLTGACVSAGKLVIVEVNVPPQTSTRHLLEKLKEEDGPLGDSVEQAIGSCIRRYPDGSLKIDLHFETRQEAESFLQLARRGMCVSGQS